MSVIPGPTGENRLLAALPSVIFERLAPSLERVRLDAGTVLYDAGEVADHVWFITRGVISLFALSEDGLMIEAAGVGREGVIGVSGVLKKVGSILRAKVQISGEALRIRAKALPTTNGQGIAIYRSLLLYSHILTNQIAQTSLCNKFHCTGCKLARWLLLAQDRTLSDSFELTHESLGEILGISRSVVTEAASALQKRSLIRYSRGRIAIRNRKKLMAASCECYGIISQTLIPHLPTDPLSATD